MFGLISLVSTVFEIVEGTLWLVRKTAVFAAAAGAAWFLAGQPGLDAMKGLTGVGVQVVGDVAYGAYSTASNCATTAGGAVLDAASLEAAKQGCVAAANQAIDPRRALAYGQSVAGQAAPYGQQMLDATGGNPANAIRQAARITQSMSEASGAVSGRVLRQLEPVRDEIRGQMPF
jgi:hypothetical protein